MMHMLTTPPADEIRTLVTLFKEGDFAALEPLALRFARDHAGHGLGWMLLAAIHKAAGRYQQALEAQLKAVEVMPPKAELYSNLGNIQFLLEQNAEAEQSYRRCLQLDPQHGKGHFNLGVLLLAAQRNHEAETHLRHALRLDPESAEARYQLALALLEQKQYSQPVLLLQEAIARRPGHAPSHDSLSFAFLNLGQVDKAVEHGRAAVKLAPEDPLVLGNLLFTLNYANAAPGEVKALAQAYGAMVSERAAGKRMASWGDDSPEPRKLRIGFVSGDFKNHPVTFFLLPLLGALDPARFECFAYSTVAYEDDYTRKVQAAVHTFRALSRASAQEAASRIHADGIHILFDLAGHTGHNRLPLFAFRPAPVQASWLGYFSTTGVMEIDYILADEVGVPGTEASQFTEQVWLLPDTRLCFSPPDPAPEVKPLPALENGYFTFGCYQSLAKVNDAVLAAWKPIFAALPRARLRWQCLQFADMQARKATFERLRKHGIAEARVQLLKDAERPEYLATYRHVDMLLDTFPFPGGTTTCEALWMGVPTLTLAGGTLLSRQGASLLTAAGLRDWVATSVEDYQRKAIAFAGDPAGLAQLRQRLREMARQSPLFDGSAFARHFEAALLSIWRKRWTAVHESSGEHDEHAH
jgi:predicted O-linked N-acetylglucosamine transferase (SPINDLY family)